MPSKTVRKNIRLLAISLVATASVSIGAHSTATANARHRTHVYASDSNASRAYTSHRHGPWFAHGATLPYAPEYGFLRRIPPNAIVGPGYTFVPGVGILGESCDLPTSACTNEYRDVR
jgi:hypothetical protein